MTNSHQLHIPTTIDGDYAFVEYRAKGQETSFGCECRVHMVTGIVELPVILVQMLTQVDLFGDKGFIESSNAFNHPVSEYIYVYGQEVLLAMDEARLQGGVRRVQSLEQLEFALNRKTLH
jgi:hypothetical protein